MTSVVMIGLGHGLSGLFCDEIRSGLSNCMGHSLLRSLAGKISAMPKRGKWDEQPDGGAT